jgi:hypothetical protein
MATELPHIEPIGGTVWIDGKGYAPKEARAIRQELDAAIVEANRWRIRQRCIARASADRLAHDSERDTRPTEDIES